MPHSPRLMGIDRTKDPFPKVREAREALKNKALELFEKYNLIIDKAIEAGNLEVAGKLTQWLIEHMPKDEGLTVIDESAAKPKGDKQRGPVAPQAFLNFQLGGMSVTPKQLPTAKGEGVPEATVVAEGIEVETKDE